MIERARPFVVVLCAVPLVGEALCDALEGIAECKVLTARQPDISGLLRSLQPDAIVVVDEAEGAAAESYVSSAEIAVVLVSLRERKLRLLQDGRWEDADEFDASPEAIRNLVARSIYGRKAAS